MLEVSIYRLDDEAHDQPAGRFRWDGAAISAEPPDASDLARMLTLPVVEPGTGHRFYPDHTPEEWLRLLHVQYAGTYLWAGEAREGSGEELSTWDESKHPRGKPENAGRFSEKRSAARLAARQTTAAIRQHIAQGDAAEALRLFLALPTDEKPRVAERLSPGEQDAINRAAAQPAKAEAPARDMPKWSGKVIEQLKQFTQRNPSESYSLPNLYRDVVEPLGVSIPDFQEGLRQLSREGRIRLIEWTQPLRTMPDERFAMIAGGEIRYYVRPSDEKAEELSTFTPALHPRGQPANKGQFSRKPEKQIQRRQERERAKAERKEQRKAGRSVGAAVAGAASGFAAGVTKAEKLLAHRVERNVDRLPKPIAVAVKAAWKFAIANFAAAHRAVKKLQEELGTPPEQAERVAVMVSMADVALAKPAFAAGTAGLGLLGGWAISSVPWASLVCCAVLASRHPIKSAKAAHRVIGAAFKAPAELSAGQPGGFDREAAERLLQKMASLGPEQQDWFTFLVAAALDQNGGDLAGAVTAADAGFAKCPEEPEEEAEELSAGRGQDSFYGRLRAELDGKH